MTEQECRALVRERSGGMCEVRIPEVCRGMAESMHHRNKVSQGGKWTPANILDACGHGTIGCHGFIEANPATARSRGLWLSRGQEAAATPFYGVFRGMLAWYLHDDEGSVTWLSSKATRRSA